MRDWGVGWGWARVRARGDSEVVAGLELGAVVGFGSRRGPTFPPASSRPSPDRTRNEQTQRGFHQPGCVRSSGRCAEPRQFGTREVRRRTLPVGGMLPISEADVAKSNGAAVPIRARSGEPSRATVRQDFGPVRCLAAIGASFGARRAGRPPPAWLDRRRCGAQRAFGALFPAGYAAWIPHLRAGRHYRRDKLLRDLVGFGVAGDRHPERRRGSCFPDRAANLLVPGRRRRRLHLARRGWAAGSPDRGDHHGAPSRSVDGGDVRVSRGRSPSRSRAGHGAAGWSGGQGGRGGVSVRIRGDSHPSPVHLLSTWAAVATASPSSIG